jgi:hypothetical protein
MACEACKTIPPVVAEGYVEKGKWEEIGGLKTCMILSSRPMVVVLSDIPLQ